MSDQPFRAGVGVVIGEHQAQERLADAIKDAFGGPSQTRVGYALAGPNDVVQLLLNADFWQWVGIVALPFATAFKEKLCEKFGDAASEMVFQKITERLKSKGTDIDRPDAERKLAAIVFALESVDDPDYIVQIGMASPGPDHQDRNIVFRLDQPSLKSFASMAVPIAILAPAVEMEIEYALSEGFIFDGWSSGIIDRPEPEARLQFSRKHPTQGSRTVSITINENGEPAIVRK